MANKKLTPEQKALYDKLTSLQKHCANAFILGKTYAQAYLIACKKLKKKPASSPRNAGSQIITKTYVAAYIRSVKDPIEEDAACSAIMTRERMLERLTEMSEGKISDLIEFSDGVVGTDEDGKPIIGMLWRFKSSDKIDPKDMALITEVKTSKDGLGIKIADQLSAMKQLAKMEGWESATKLDLSSKDGTMTPKGFNEFYGENPTSEDVD